MCWAACDRLAKIANHMGMTDRATQWRGRAKESRDKVLERAWVADAGYMADSFGGREVDASLLLIAELGFLPADDPRFAGTVDAIAKQLRRGDHMFRYIAPDDFGVPENAFTICTFWYIEALAAIGRTDEARRIFTNMLNCRNHVGLLSEDIAVQTGELWGNYPQTYSLVGIIHGAMRLSRPWEEAR
jgi:GH15 family glucan-1,4-alpha-glucosidase